jgi:hypothetical protein
MVTLTTGIMFLLFTCMHFWACGVFRRWYTCVPDRVWSGPRLPKVWETLSNEDASLKSAEHLDVVHISLPIVFVCFSRHPELSLKQSFNICCHYCSSYLTTRDIFPQLCSWLWSQFRFLWPFTIRQVLTTSLDPGSVEVVFSRLLILCQMRGGASPATGKQLAAKAEHVHGVLYHWWRMP